MCPRAQSLLFILKFKFIASLVILAEKRRFSVNKISGLSPALRYKDNIHLKSMKGTFVYKYSDFSNTSMLGFTGSSCKRVFFSYPTFSHFLGNDGFTMNRYFYFREIVNFILVVVVVLQGNANSYNCFVYSVSYL